MRDIRLLDQMFLPGSLIGPFTQAHPGLGGVCTFVGEVRGEARAETEAPAGGAETAGGADETDGQSPVEALELLHYAPLTLPGMHQLADGAFERFELMGLLMVHRIGVLHPGEPIVCVSAAALHRNDAMDAVRFCMDHLKSAQWFWKRELRKGRWHWIEPTCGDHAARKSWEV